MYCGINRWEYFEREKTFAAISFKKGGGEGGLIFDGRPVFEAIVHVEDTNKYYTHMHCGNHVCYCTYCRSGNLSL